MPAYMAPRARPLAYAERIASDRPDVATSSSLAGGSARPADVRPIPITADRGRQGGRRPAGIVTVAEEDARSSVGSSILPQASPATPGGL